MSRSNLFGSGANQRGFARKLLALQQSVDASDRQLCPAHGAPLIDVHQQIADGAHEATIARPAHVFRDLADDAAWQGFVRLLLKERHRGELFRPDESLIRDAKSVTVPIVFVDPRSNRGVMANLNVQAITGAGKVYRHPSLSFITFDDDWIDGIDQAVQTSTSRGGWMRSERLCNVDLVWNVILQDLSGLPVEGVCGGGSAAGAFDLSFYLLEEPTRIGKYSGIVVTAGIRGNSWTEVCGYLPKLREAWSFANPPIHTALVAKVSPRTDELAHLVSGYQALDEQTFQYRDGTRNSLTVVEAENLDDGIKRLDRVGAKQDWLEEYKPRTVSDEILSKDEIERSLLIETDVLRKRGAALWLHGPPGSGKSWLLRYLYELRLRRGSAPFYYECQKHGESGAAVVRNLLSQISEWQQVHIGKTAGKSTELKLRPQKGSWVVIDGIDQIATDLKDLHDFVRKDGQDATWVFSSIHPHADPGISLNLRTRSINDFRDPVLLARQIILRRNQQLPGAAQLSDVFVDAILEKAPVPLVINICFDEIEDAESGAAHLDVKFWTRDVQEVVRKRLNQQRRLLDELSGPAGSARLMLIILSLLNRWPSDGLPRNEETVKLLTGQNFSDFDSVAKRVAWLFESDSLDFSHPSFVSAIQSLWAPEDSVALQEARMTMAKSCLGILERWYCTDANWKLDTTGIPVAVASLPIEKYAWRTALWCSVSPEYLGEFWSSQLSEQSRKLLEQRWGTTSLRIFASLPKDELVDRVQRFLMEEGNKPLVSALPKWLS